MKNPYKISIVGLGYVGLTIATAFSKLGEVIGVDTSKIRIAELKKGYDRNGEISKEKLIKCKILYTTDYNQLSKANFHIVAIPTPVSKEGKPVLTMLVSATTMLAKQLKKGDIVVYESSVYPGITEEKCIPILEKFSKLKCGKDFGVGFSPERISPGDKVHTLINIPKIISATNEATLNKIAKVYSAVVKAGVHKVSTIRIAEAVKLIENAQRDMNISFMNEVALILHSLNMDSTEVLQAAATKWNFINFKPGLVGGHCIGVCANYLAFTASEAGYKANLILAGRKVNEYMPKFIAENVVKQLAKLHVPIQKARVGIFGLTYKEDCPDIHDTRIIDIVHELEDYSMSVIVHDPIAEPAIAKREFNIDLKKLSQFKDLDVLIIMVAHKQYKQMDSKKILSTLKDKGVIMDIKGIIDTKKYKETDVTIWRL